VSAADAALFMSHHRALLAEEAAMMGVMGVGNFGAILVNPSNNKVEQMTILLYYYLYYYFMLVYVCSCPCHYI
jgi:hypothetical protein